MPIVRTVDCAPELSVISPVYASEAGDLLRNSLQHLNASSFQDFATSQRWRYSLIFWYRSVSLGVVTSFGSPARGA